MMRWLMLCTVALWVAGWADEPAPSARADMCQVLNNRILGPRLPDRPLPLLSGDPAKGLHAACSVPWSKLSPANQPLPVTDCHQGSLLQVANEAACGSATGRLWINARWVITSAELQDKQAHAAVCQQLETGAWAGTRDFPLECVPKIKERSFAAAPADDTPAPPAATPAEERPASPHPDR